MSSDSRDGARRPARELAPNVFAGSYLDRCTEKRRDRAWLEQTLHSAAARFVPIWGDHTFVSHTEPVRAAFLPPALARELPEAGGAHVFLGIYNADPLFAIDLPAHHPADEQLRAHGKFENIRKHATRLPADDAGVLAYARALALWHRTHAFCGVCGSPLASRDGGHLRVCLSKACGQHQFPRMDPAVIVLVTRGDRCLLGRQASWPPEVYSTIAGFVEPGESLEDAVRREVEEETNVQVTKVRYHSSQPWPFPSSLMLGFTAEAQSDDIRLNDDELVDARWFTRDDIRGRIEQVGRSLPARLSIAFRLVADWYDDGEPGKLAARIASSREA